jgi:hypothetical protein
MKLNNILKIVKTKRFIAAAVITVATVVGIVAVTKGTQLVEIDAVGDLDVDA